MDRRAINADLIAEDTARAVAVRAGSRIRQTEPAVLAGAHRELRQSPEVDQ